MTLLYAHRGAAAELPENTIEAFALALELGADALEMDVHCTADGVVVVSHDGTGERMAGVDRTIATSTWNDVKDWDAGWGFLDSAGGHPHRGKHFRIPRLRDVLSQFASVPINIDIKAHTADAARRVVDEVRCAKATDRVTLASFSYPTLLRVRRLGYEGRTSLAPPEVVALVLCPKIVVSRIPYFGKAAQIPTEQGPIKLARRSFIKKCHDLGLEVHFWTINDPGEAKSLASLGADAVMTDDPRVVGGALASRQASS